MIGLTGQKCKQVKLFRRKGPFLSIDPHSSGCRVNLETTNLNLFVLRYPAADKPVIAGQMRFSKTVPPR